MPPKYVRGTLGKVVVIELHAQELPVERRTSTVSDGVVLLRYIAKAVSNERVMQNMAQRPTPSARTKQRSTNINIKRHLGTKTETKIMSS